MEQIFNDIKVLSASFETTEKFLNLVISLIKKTRLVMLEEFSESIEVIIIRDRFSTTIIERIEVVYVAVKNGTIFIETEDKEYYKIEDVYSLEDRLKILKQFMDCAVLN